WGLVDPSDPGGAESGRALREAPPAGRVRTAFFVTAVALGVAALVHLVRYLLLVINRNMLLNWPVADAAALLSVLASWATMAGFVAIGCLPLLGAVWALVYVIELAKTEEHYARLRGVIWGWWLL